MTRDEHLEWCKKRALEYLDEGDLQNAFASMGSDLSKHPDFEKILEVMFHSGLSGITLSGRRKTRTERVKNPKHQFAVLSNFFFHLADALKLGLEVLSRHHFQNALPQHVEGPDVCGHLHQSSPDAFGGFFSSRSFNLQRIGGT